MRKRVLATLVLAAGLMGGVGNQTNAGTLSCYKSWPPTSPLGDVPSISSSTSRTLFPELCDAHVPSCEGECYGELR